MPADPGQRARALTRTAAAAPQPLCGRGGAVPRGWKPRELAAADRARDATAAAVRSVQQAEPLQRPPPQPIHKTHIAKCTTNPQAASKALAHSVQPHRAPTLSTHIAVGPVQRVLGAGGASSPLRSPTRSPRSRLAQRSSKSASATASAAASAATSARQSPQQARKRGCAAAACATNINSQCACPRKPASPAHAQVRSIATYPRLFAYPQKAVEGGADSHPEPCDVKGQADVSPRRTGSGAKVPPVAHAAALASLRRRTLVSGGGGSGVLVDVPLHSSEQGPAAAGLVAGADPAAGVRDAGTGARLRGEGLSAAAAAAIARGVAALLAHGAVWRFLLKARRWGPAWAGNSVCALRPP